MSVQISEIKCVEVTMTTMEWVSVRARSTPVCMLDMKSELGLSLVSEHEWDEIRIERGYLWYILAEEKDLLGAARGWAASAVPPKRAASWVTFMTRMKRAAVVGEY